MQAASSQRVPFLVFKWVLCGSHTIMWLGGFDALVGWRSVQRASALACSPIFSARVPRLGAAIQQANDGGFLCSRRRPQFGSNSKGCLSCAINRVLASSAAWCGAHSGQNTNTIFVRFIFSYIHCTYIVNYALSLGAHTVLDNMVYGPARSSQYVCSWPEQAAGHPAVPGRLPVGVVMNCCCRAHGHLNMMHPVIYLHAFT